MESPVQCGCNAHAAPGFFSLAGTAVKASETDAQPDAAGSVLRGLGSLPNKQKIAFVSRKPCLLRMFLSFRLLSPTTEKKRFCQTYAKEKRCNLKKDYNAF